jgi:NADH-quinone oxidoreductase subunit I
MGALGVTFRNLFRKTVTEPLPWKATRKRPERYRSTFALVHDDKGEEACIGCKMCEKICPSDVISVVPGGRKESPVTGKKRGYCDDFTLDLNACIVCELCVQVCPTDAIIMLSTSEKPGFGREDLVLTMDKLYANEGLEKESWATGTLLMEMQNPKRGLPEPEPKPKVEPKVEAKVEPKVEPKVEAKVEPKVEPKVEVPPLPEDAPTDQAPLPTKTPFEGEPE